MTARWFAGIRVSLSTLEELSETISRALDGAGRFRVTFLNPDYARRALLDPQLRADINGFDIVAVDGNGVRMLAPLFGFTVPERVDTDRLAPHLFRLLAQRGGRLFLFGCAPGVAEEAGRRLAAAFPGLRVVGTEHGYHDVERGHPGRFEARDSERIVAAVNHSQTDVLLVSLPTPLQQRWVAEHGDSLTAPVVLTGGSYLDHAAAGTSGTWYPRWADALRLNWFYRLMRQPRRLWRRYTLEIAHFVFLVLRARLVDHDGPDTPVRVSGRTTRARTASAGRRPPSGPPSRPG
jgi:N-acetylglucosaminyldiphosphoundecaprenol N-acetyl-beta-D-mannosaminyltransferase